MQENPSAAGAPLWTQLWELTALPQPTPLAGGEGDWLPPLQQLPALGLSVSPLLFSTPKLCPSVPPLNAGW